MILHPAIVALLLVSFLTAAMSLAGVLFAIRIIRRWDLASGSEAQLLLERQTYLISTIFAYLLIFEIGSLFLFIYTADSLHTLFTGAMCAAGVLYADPYGYPTFLLKIVNVLLAGLWLIVNGVDNGAHDYPLIRKKYGLLLLLAPLIWAEALLQALYFGGLKADVITSCCGSLFGTSGSGLPSDMAALPAGMAMAVFFLMLVLILIAGGITLFRSRLAFLFSVVSTLFFLVACLSFVSFISLYFYELPTHHCPFCVLQREYAYVGYLLYGTLMVGAVAGLGVGLLNRYRKVPSLAGQLPSTQRRLALWCLTAYLLFAALTVQRMVATDFTLGFLP